MRFALPTLLLTALMPGATAAQQAPTITKREMRAQRPALTDRQLRDQLWSIFRREDRRRKQAPRALLDEVWNETRPYATTVKGLCRYDVVVLRFAPDPSTSDLNAETPVRAYGVTASAKFRFLRRPSADGDTDRALDPWRGECTSIDPAKTDFFDAPDESVALDGYRAWLAAIDAVGNGTAKVAPCDRYQDETASCEAIVAEMAKSMPTSIGRCDAAALLACFAVDVDDREIRIVRVAYPNYRDARDVPQPIGTIMSVSLASYITFADARVD